MKSILISIKPEYVEKILSNEQKFDDEEWKDLIGYEGLYIISNYGEDQFFQKFRSFSLKFFLSFYKICVFNSLLLENFIV